MFVPAVPAVPARMWLDLDMMVGGGDSPASAGAAPPPLDTSQRGGKGGRRPKRVQAGKVEPGDSKAPPVGPLWKTRICSFFAAGGCRNAAQCPFAHGEEDLMPSPDFERTSVCPFLLSRGRCDKPGCRYAHHAEELRVQEGLLKTKMCAFYQHDQCIVGEACRFAHSEREIEQALTMQRAAAQRSRQPPPRAVEPPAQEGSRRWLLRSAFDGPPDAAGDPGPWQLPEQPWRSVAWQQAAREPSPLAPSAADSSAPQPARVPLPAFSLTAPPGLLEFPARVSDSKVVIDTGLAAGFDEDMVLDIEEEVITSSALLESGSPQKVPVPSPYSRQLLARVVTLEEEVAELAPREPAATSRSREEQLLL